MTHQTADEFQTAVGAYLSAPTSNNRDRLIAAADEYREQWIVAQASRERRPGRPNNARIPPTTYDRALEVMRVIDGIPVKLAVQERTLETEHDPWWTLSWRTKYSAQGSNRRFYLVNGSCWTISATVALEMMDELAALDGMHERYFDRRPQSDAEPIVSTSLAAQQRIEAFSRVTGPDENWGRDPYFVINPDSNRNWKKVLIVNATTGIATFRSITEDTDYMPKKVLRPGVNWWLDNSMMDASVQQMRVFQAKLREYLGR